jgi:hypothetical protein
MDFIGVGDLMDDDTIHDLGFIGKKPIIKFKLFLGWETYTIIG